MKTNNRPRHWRVIELRGHIIDSLTLSKLYDEIISRGGDYLSEEISIGKRKDDPSYARIRVEAPDRDHLDSILSRLAELGAVPTACGEIAIESSPDDGLLPDHFYSTTNLDTEIFTNNSWIEVKDIAMDCAIRVGEREDGTPIALAVKIKDVKKGDAIVVGSTGVRVTIPERASERRSFGFMTSSISAERPAYPIIDAIAEEISDIREKGGSNGILFVCGPAIVHTGSRGYLSELIDKGYVGLLFAGNALAAHDMEASLFGTSLGVSLCKGVSVFGGSNHHLRAINIIRRAGGIRDAVKEGTIKDGIMYSCIKNGVDFLLAGSIRDDGPLPEVITDVLEAQTMMREKLRGVKMVIMISTMLHSIAVGNLLPAHVRTVCIDIDYAMITKLADRGTRQMVGIVMDAGSFLRELSERLP